MSGTDVTPDMGFDFLSLTKFYVPLVKGNIPLAQAMAYRDLTGKFGKTGVGMSANGITGERAVKYPPEMLLDASTAAVNVALMSYAKNEAIDNADGIILRATNNTPKNHIWEVLTYDEEFGFTKHTDFAGSKWLVQGYKEQQEDAKAAARRHKIEQEILNAEAMRSAEYWDSLIQHSTSLPRE